MPANFASGKQVRNSVPVPRRADSAVYQGSSPASQHLRRVGDESASALPITGRRRSHLLLTVGWLHLKIFAAAACWTILRRISATTRTTERKRSTQGWGQSRGFGACWLCHGLVWFRVTGGVYSPRRVRAREPVPCRPSSRRAAAWLASPARLRTLVTALPMEANRRGDCRAPRTGRRLRRG